MSIFAFNSIQIGQILSIGSQQQPLNHTRHSNALPTDPGSRCKTNGHEFNPPVQKLQSLFTLQRTNSPESWTPFLSILCCTQQALIFWPLYNLDLNTTDLVSFFHGKWDKKLYQTVTICMYITQTESLVSWKKTILIQQYCQWLIVIIPNYCLKTMCIEHIINWWRKQ